jgi:serine protease Do
MRRIILFLSCLVGAVIVAYVIGVRAGAARADGPQAAQAQRAVALNKGETMDTNLFRNIAKQENPVVVFITTQTKVQASPQDLFGNDFFQRFFGVPMQPQTQVQRALGSGFLISADGDILTNNHVVAGAQQIKVGLFGNDRRTYDARVVGRDVLTDSALIRLEKGPGNLPVATLGDSSQMQPGDWVMAIGNPFQLGHTVTVGVISYSGRSFTVREGRSEDMLQTDAAINPGNSGGPLINVRGEVIGINAAILAGGDTGGNIGIGFAVPINTVKNLLPQLRKGKVVRGRLGLQVRTAPLTADEARQLGLPSAEGALVAMVQRDSPASKAGIQPGDVIVSYGGKPVVNADALVQMVTSTAPGTRVPVRLYRGGKPVDVTVTVEELTGEGEGQGGGAGSAESLGLQLQNITPDVAQQLRLPPGVGGALVAGVQDGSAASDAGLQRGDVIMEVNRQRITSAQGAARALQAVPNGQTAFVLVWRQGDEMLLTLQR